MIDIIKPKYIIIGLILNPLILFMVIDDILIVIILYLVLSAYIVINREIPTWLFYSYFINLILLLTMTLTMTDGVPDKIEKINNIKLSMDNIKDKRWLYIDYEGSNYKLDTGPGCAIGDTTLFYKASFTIPIIGIIQSDYYIECNRPIVKPLNTEPFYMD